MPEIVSRYVSTALEDFEGRDVALRDLGEVLELIVKDAAVREEILDSAATSSHVRQEVAPAQGDYESEVVIVSPTRGRGWTAVMFLVSDRVGWVG